MREADVRKLSNDPVASSWSIIKFGLKTNKTAMPDSKTNLRTRPPNDGTIRLALRRRFRFSNMI